MRVVNACQSRAGRNDQRTSGGKRNWLRSRVRTGVFVARRPHGEGKKNPSPFPNINPPTPWRQITIAPKLNPVKQGEKNLLQKATRGLGGAAERGLRGGLCAMRAREAIHGSADGL